jgi:cytochrome c oxidase subunit 2
MFFRKASSLSSIGFATFSGVVVMLCFLFSSSLSAEPVLAADLPEYRIANIFDPVSTPAQAILESAYLVLAVTTGIFVIVGGLLAYAVIRFRRRPGDDSSEPPQIYGGTQIELAWTVLPILITLVLILVTARTIGEIQNKEIPEDALVIRLVGHQWWWEVHYPQYGFVTANEIHVPVSSSKEPRITHILLESADVIHSFWVARLAGKTDLIPNRRNETWIEPFQTGIYFGNCAEYCGTQHANMLIRVVVHEPEDFDRWVKQQQAPPAFEPAVAHGERLFFSTACINCHAVNGTVAEGVFGPDLTKLATRMTLGAGVLPLNEENLRAWIRDPQAIKKGALMPDMKLSDDEVDAIAAYLMTMK